MTTFMPIKAFADDTTEAAFNGFAHPRIPADIRRRAQVRLEMLHAAARLDHLRFPPGNRLEALTGDRQGQHSIRVNQQWRICFRWSDGDAFEVELVDYHQEEEELMPDTHRLPPVHPGEILREEFLEPLGLTAYRVAKEIGVPQQRIVAIVREQRAITPDTAARLGRYFFGDGVDGAEFWMRLQMRYDLRTAMEQSGGEIEAIEPHPASRSQARL